MMTQREIYENALANLRETATRQHELAIRYMRHPKGPEWRAKYNETKAKVVWLERLIALWEGR